ncbi:MAG TPA: hypothetical protein VIW69_09655, partial [Candidatus Elarobacter sp.]
QRVMTVLRAIARPMVASIFVIQGYETFRRPERVAARAEPVVRPLAEAVEAEAARYVIGAHSGGVQLIGPSTGEAFNTLAWLVAGQYLALSIGRANYVESDAPRGLHKWVG